MNVWQAGLSEPIVKFMKNPEDLEAIQGVFKCYSQDTNVRKALEKILFANEDFKALYDAWYTPKKFTLEQLLQLPEDTFGRFYAEHMEKNNLSIDFITDLGGDDIVSYLWHRAQHVHDITHVITDFDTSLMGELAVKGFELAQYGSPAVAGILGSGFLTVTTILPDKTKLMMDAIIKGYTKGQNWPLLMAIKWDQEWETPVMALKQKYHIPT